MKLFTKLSKDGKLIEIFYFKTRLITYVNSNPDQSWTALYENKYQMIDDAECLARELYVF